MPEIAGPVALVGHSLGGLVALEALRRQPDLPVSRVVCLGSPLRGSGTVYFPRDADQVSLPQVAATPAPTSVPAPLTLPAVPTPTEFPHCGDLLGRTTPL